MTVPTFIDSHDRAPAGKDAHRTFPYEDVQFAIEQVYELRSKVIRIGLMGTLLHRPDPDCAPCEKERADHLSVLETEVGVFQKVITLLEAGGQIDGVSPQIAQWMTDAAQQNSDDLAILKEVSALTTSVLQAAQTRSKNQSYALKQHRKVTRAGFHEAVTDLCLTLWREYDKDQSLRLVRAQSAAAVLGERLTRLERIGTHVRLVSLNASVEASHIGHQGRGLSLIAQEFKGLAEEVTNLAQDARVDVNQMLETE